MGMGIPTSHNRMPRMEPHTPPLWECLSATPSRAAMGLRSRQWLRVTTVAQTHHLCAEVCRFFPRRRAGGRERPVLRQSLVAVVSQPIKQCCRIHAGRGWRAWYTNSSRHCDRQRHVPDSVHRAGNGAAQRRPGCVASTARPRRTASLEGLSDESKRRRDHGPHPVWQPVRRGRLHAAVGEIDPGFHHIDRAAREQQVGIRPGGRLQCRYRPAGERHRGDQGIEGCIPLGDRSGKVIARPLRGPR